MSATTPTIPAAVVHARRAHLDALDAVFRPRDVARDPIEGARVTMGVVHAQAGVREAACHLAAMLAEQGGA